MRFEKQNLIGNPFIGVFSATTDNLTFIPSAASSKFSELVETTLGTKPIALSLCNSSLIGLFSVSNQSGIVVPEMAYENELEALEEHFDRIGIISQYTAIGNLVTCNDKGCVASPLLSPKSKKTLEKTLKVKVKQMTIAGIDVVGSSVIATNKGFLTNPNITDPELVALEHLFGVEGNVGSINYGVPFVKSGLIANSHGAIIGSLTTSYELGRIDEALFLGRE